MKSQEKEYKVIELESEGEILERREPKQNLLKARKRKARGKQENKN